MRAIKLESKQFRTKCLPGDLFGRKGHFMALGLLIATLLLTSCTRTSQGLSTAQTTRTPSSMLPLPTLTLRVITAVPIPTITPVLVQDFSSRHSWSPDGASIAVGSFTGLQIYDTASLKLQKTLLENQPCCAQIVYRDSLLAAVHGKNSLVTAWDLTSAQVVFSLDKEDQEIQSLAISPDQKYIAVGEKAQVEVWQLDTPDPIATLPMGGTVTNLAFTASGNSLVLTTQYELTALQEWDFHSKLMLRSYPIYKNVLFFTFGPTANTMMVDYGDAGLQLWDLTGFYPVYYYSQITGTPGSTSVAGDRVKVAVWGNGTEEGNTATLWDLNQGMVIQQFSKGATGEWKFLSFSPDSKLIALSDSLGHITIYDIATGAEKASLLLPGKYARN
jgi:WD40 repeat protein